MRGVLKSIGVIALLAIGAWAHGQLSLDEALALAKERNGTIRAAQFELQGARSAVRQARASLLPTVTPTLRYDASETQQFTGTSFNASRSGTSFDVTANWRLLDNGARRFGIERASAAALASQAQALQTLRTQLFQVTSGFYEVLRAQELLRVQRSQFDRADLILRQTRARAEVGDIARKDVLQAEADQLNARVAVLGAEIRLKNATAGLKALIGWADSQGTLSVSPPTEARMEPAKVELDEAKRQALANRLDLKATRQQVESQRIAVRLARADAGLGFSVDATYTRSFARDVFNRSSVGLVASFPLFDGNQSREVVKERQSSLQASLARLEQSERDILASVEQAYSEYNQNLLRMDASKLALAAAQKNFDAASRSQALGAANLVEVVQAQTSLVTAEVNAVEALYDALISEANLNLALGNPVRGE